MTYINKGVFGWYGPLLTYVYKYIGVLGTWEMCCFFLYDCSLNKLQSDQKEES